MCEGNQSEQNTRCDAAAPIGPRGKEAVRSLLITGVSSGIGYETLRYALTRGARVFGSVRNHDDGRRLSAEFGGRFVPLIFDDRDESAARAAAGEVRTILDGRTLDAVISNAGIGIPGPVLYQSLKELRDQIDTDLFAAFVVTQCFAPLLGADRSLSGPRGRLVIVSSIGGLIGQPFASGNIASKHGLEGFCDSVRRELMLFDIPVINIAPSAVRTPIWDKLGPTFGKYRDTEYAAIFDRGVRAMMTMGNRWGLEPRAVAEVIWEALTSARPRRRYAPARFPVLEQWVPRLLPKSVVDMAFRYYLRLGAGKRLEEDSEVPDDEAAASHDRKRSGAAVADIAHAPASAASNP